MTTGKYFTLGEAAKETGVQKSTLSKALKSGKLSYIEKTSAGYKIEASELYRVYPKKPQDTVATTVEIERLDIPENNPDFIRLEVEVNQLRERLEETQQQRDEWMNQAKQLALPSPQNQNDDAGQGGNYELGWWDKLLGRKAKA